MVGHLVAFEPDDVFTGARLSVSKNHPSPAQRLAGYALCEVTRFEIGV